MYRYKSFVFLLLIFLSALIVSGQSIQDQSYFTGRSYYVLRAGNIKMILQAEKVNILPAFTYLLFDANNTGQTQRKHMAFNYNSDNAYLSSALGIKTKDYWYTAMGQHCKTKWVLKDNIPSVEAVWWAGGIKVTEVISPVSDKGIFKRSITLYSANLVTEESLSIRLSLPESATLAEENVLLLNKDSYSISIVGPDDFPISFTDKKESMIVHPISIKPGEKKIFESYIVVKTSQSSENTDLFAFAKNVTEYCKEDAKNIAQRWEHSNQVFTNDTLIKNMFDVNRFILPSYISESGKMDAGIFEYGAQWVRDASLTTIGLIQCGEFELAKASIINMLENMINDEGTTMIAGGFDEPDREQFDQMGEFMHCMKSYVNWTGDTSLLVLYRQKILTMIERPLNPLFRDSTGMVHNRREYWERTFDDAYELAYQTWMVQGLIDAADLAQYLGVREKADEWRSHAKLIQSAMINHPEMKLTDNGHLIKRRNITGEIADTVEIDGYPGTPSFEEEKSRLMPDATMALPIALNIIAPKSELSINTLQLLEQLKNQRWSIGGYDRYHTSSQIDQPGPWSFASTFIMRAQHEAGLMDLSRNTLEWLNDIGGRTGAFYEVIPILREQEIRTGLLPWTSGEICLFVIHHYLGLKFKGNTLTINPATYNGNAPINADLRFRNGRINLQIEGEGDIKYATINSKKYWPDKSGSIQVPDSFNGGDITIVRAK